MSHTYHFDIYALRHLIIRRETPFVGEGDKYQSDEKGRQLTARVDIHLIEGEFFHDGKRISEKDAAFLCEQSVDWLRGALAFMQYQKEAEERYKEFLTEEAKKLHNEAFRLSKENFRRTDRMILSSQTRKFSADTEECYGPHVRIIRGLPTDLISVSSEVRLFHYTGHLWPACVYFLCAKQRVVYVGQSTSLHTRICCHQGDKWFDSVFFLTCPKDERMTIEKRFIDELRPHYNFLGEVEEPVEITELKSEYRTPEDAVEIAKQVAMKYFRETPVHPYYMRLCEIVDETKASAPWITEKHQHLNFPVKL